VRVTLVSAAMSEAMRAARFDDDSPLDAAGLRQARAAAGVPTHDQVHVSPSVRCRQTAEALGLQAGSLPELRGRAMGRWRGRSLDEVSAAEPAEVGRWLSDPAFAPPDGETLVDLLTRVGSWLDSLSPDAGRLLAVVEPDVVRAAVLHALGAPGPAFWRLDVQPLSVTELSGRTGRWNARCGRPLV